MHGRSLAWVRDRCQVEGAGRALLYAIAAFAERHEGYCTASYRTLARAAGGKPRWTVEMLQRFVAGGVLELVDRGAGRRPSTYRIHPSLWASGAPTAPQEDPVVVHSTTRSGALTDPVVVQSPFRSGAVPMPLTSANGRQDKNVEEKNFEDSAGVLTPAGRARPQVRASTAVEPGRPSGVHDSDWAEVSEASRKGIFPDWLHDQVCDAVDSEAELLTRHDGTQYMQLSNGTVIPNARQAFSMCYRATP